VVEALKNWNIKSDPYFNERSVLAFDLDDTLTEDGVLPSFVVESLERAQKAGILTILVTGRSDGWAETLIKLLPFDAIVAENGGLLRYWSQTKMRRKAQEKANVLYWDSSKYQSQRPNNLLVDLKDLETKVLQKFPKVQVASDQAHRIYDLAIDFAEEVFPPRTLEEAQELKEFCERSGFTAKVSSIHVNAWKGAFSKWSGLDYLLREVFKKDMKKNLVYVGDSPNDAPLFEAADMSVGVANIKNFIGKLSFALPKFISSKESSRGACEVMEILLGRNS
jgi:HAD superfamily hydrolase (TIGR01484 family)